MASKKVKQRKVKKIWLLDPDTTEYPFVLDVCTKFLRQERKDRPTPPLFSNVPVDLTLKGLFRISGSHDEIQALRKVFDKGITALLLYW